MKFAEKTWTNIGGKKKLILPFFCLTQEGSNNNG